MFSSDATRLAVMDAFAKRIRVYDPASGAELASYEWPPGNGTTVVFRSDGLWAATRQADQTIVLSVVDRDQRRGVLDVPRSGILDLVFSPDGRHLAAACQNGTVRLWDVDLGEEVVTIVAHTGDTQCVAFSSDGQRLASVSLDGTLKIWNPADGEVLRDLPAGLGGLSHVAFSADGSQVLAGNFGGTVKSWVSATGQSAGIQVEGRSDRRGLLSISPCNRYLAAVDNRNLTIQLLDLKTGQPLAQLRGHTAGIGCLVFSRDGRYLVSGSDDRTVRVWESADGLRLASGSIDAAVSLWDTETGKEMLSLPTHHMIVPALEFSPDGRRLAAVINDFTIVVWDATPLPP